MGKKEVKQGDIYMVNLDGIESEETGIRPCICLSCNILTRNRKNVIIAPITSKVNRKKMINHYILFQEDYPMFAYPKNIILLECLRDISKKRLERYLGSVSDEDLENVIKKINYNFIEMS